jgi:PAS domain S-box-containing protein
MDLKQQEYENYINIINQFAIVSKTDLKGNITFVNDYFKNVSEYDSHELLGKPHNIIRHAETPQTAFKDMWQTIKSGNTWEGKIKNKTKSGGYYITATTVYPIFDNNNKDVVEYMSVRFLITDEEDNQAQFRDKIGKSMIKFKTQIKDYSNKTTNLENMLQKKDANKKYIDEVYKVKISKYKQRISDLRARHADITNEKNELKTKNTQLEENLDRIIRNKLEEKDRIIQSKNKELKKQENFINELCDMQNSFKNTIQELKQKLTDAIDEKDMNLRLLEASAKQSKKRLELIGDLENELERKR